MRTVGCYFIKTAEDSWLPAFGTVTYKYVSKENWIKDVHLWLIYSSSSVDVLLYLVTFVNLVLTKSMLQLVESVEVHVCKSIIREYLQYVYI